MDIDNGVPDERGVGESLRGVGAEVESAEGQITATLEGGRIVLVPKRFAPNSEFSRVVLGLHNMFRGVATDNDAGRASALELLERCDLMFGVRCEPPATKVTRAGKPCSAWPHEWTR